MLFKITRRERKALNTLAILILLGVIGLWIL
jgi:hypothetical protein